MNPGKNGRLGFGRSPDTIALECHISIMNISSALGIAIQDSVFGYPHHPNENGPTK